MSRVQIRAEEQRWRRGDVLVVAAALTLGAAIAWIMLSVQSLNHDLREANAARTALARQVERLGGTPVAGPAGDQGEPGVSVTGPPGAQGVPGEPGPSGAVGKAGASGKPGAAGSPGPAGPAGAQGPQGVPGPAGPRGEAGPAGRDGADGVDGHSCPDGYSMQAPKWDVDALVCQRDEAPEPGPSDEPGNSGLRSVGLDPQRRQYT